MSQSLGISCTDGYMAASHQGSRRMKIYYSEVAVVGTYFMRKHGKGYLLGASSMEILRRLMENQEDSYGRLYQGV